MHEVGQESGESNPAAKKKWAIVRILQLTESPTTY